MGKPFAKELEKITETLEWGFSQDTEKIKEEILHNNKKPLFIVGSGGSLSACHYAAVLYQSHGMMAKAITPLELFYSKQALRESNLLFVSASGKNTDILFGYKTAISLEPNRLYSLCMKQNSPLGKLAKEISIGHSFDFSMPAGKDGFLATNSLIAFFSILYKVFTPVEKNEIELPTVRPDFLNLLDVFITTIKPDYTFTILYAGWGEPVAIDIESKLAEAALGDVLYSDYRNFGHGRHHWFDKRKANSAIIALITPDERELAQKTLSLLPAEIPVLRIESEFTDGLASIDLLMQSFYLTLRLGQIQKIDPGRPGVPDFGSKLYNLKYSNIYKPGKTKESEDEKIAIVRKANVTSFEQLSKKEKKYWSDGYAQFKSNLLGQDFGILILDYDGTLCSSKDRYTGPDSTTSKYLIEFLEKGFIIGIATGRGKSVRTDLQKILPKKHWEQILIGYYNCSDFGLLNENHLPDKTLKTNQSLIQIQKVLENYTFVEEVVTELKPNQLTIEIKDKGNWGKVRSSIIQLIMEQGISYIQILESSHSMDIIDQTVTSKLNITKRCQALAATFKVSDSYLCIGDKGLWPGNDYHLLSSANSLSVDEVSPLINSCWNLSKPGIKNIMATQYYLSKVSFSEKSFKIQL